MKNYRLGILLIAALLPGCGSQEISNLQEPGLVGGYYGNDDFTKIKEAEVIRSLDLNWNEETGHGNSWSAIWEGNIIAPVSGDISFFLASSQKATLEIDDETVNASDDGGIHHATLKMSEATRYPIKLKYQHYRGGNGYVRVTWSWKDQSAAPIPPEKIFFTSLEAERWNWTIEPDPTAIDMSGFIIPRMQHVIVYDEPGRFCGWPANNGIWSWGDEILVGFTLAWYQEKELHHSVDEKRSSLSVLARSLDGGLNWRIEDPSNFVGDGNEVRILKDPISFTNPDFAMRSSGDEFFYSYDRGKIWNGPFKYPVLTENKLTSRTDYLVIDEKNCLVFLSAEEDRVQARLQDRAFCSVTEDGGQSYHFLSWMTDKIEIRSVMPSTVRIGKNYLVSAMRRRFDQRFENKPNRPENWIDVYESRDEGKSWQFLSTVSQTDRGKHNGNPPSLIYLRDGRLCVTYGYRGVPYGIRARISRDLGKSWGKEILLRDDGLTFDLGYTRSVQREDGQIVTVYYFTSEERKEQHIAATIWDPGS